MKTLKDVKWEFFKIGDLFTALRPMARSENDYHEGKVPFVASGAVNNGVTKFCKPSDNEHIDKGYCISVSPVDGSCHFHEYDFLGRGGAGSSILILYPKDMISRNIALFIVKCISQTTMSKYSYGLMASKERLLCDVFQLPVTPDGTPDYKYMEQYMRCIEKKLLKRYSRYLEKKGFNLLDNNYTGEGNIDKAERWEPMSINEIFPVIQRGKRLKNEDHIPGNMPYVSSSAVDNGVDDFVSNEEKVRVFNDCITIANSGSVGASFYHPYTFVASDHVTQLQRQNGNKYTYLFLANISSRLSEKYSFNREINEPRIKRERLLVPLTPDGTPDYKYMEQYMREKEKKIIHRYIEYRLKNV